MGSGQKKRVLFTEITSFWVFFSFSLNMNSFHFFWFDPSIAVARLYSEIKVALSPALHILPVTECNLMVTEVCNVASTEAFLLCIQRE
jgi:hypothetical protein